MALLNFVFIGPMQDTLLLLMCTPLYLSTRSLSQDQYVVGLNRVDILASGLFLTLLLFEVIADDQQFMYQTRKYALLEFVKHDKNQLPKEYRRGFLCNSGLWQYSRHPNFFAEMSMWWCIYLFSIATYVQGQEEVDWMNPELYLNWTIVGTFFLTMLFQSSTGLTEVNFIIIIIRIKETKE